MKGDKWEDEVPSKHNLILMELLIQLFSAAQPVLEMSVSGTGHVRPVLHPFCIDLRPLVDCS